MRFLIPAVPVHVATTLCPVLFSNWGISSRTISFVAPVASIAMSAALALEGETKRTAAAKTNAILIARPPGFAHIVQTTEQVFNGLWPEPRGTGPRITVL